ncbi:MAG: helix-turn-helix domain-containing protein [Pseudomonadota bacterium]
MTPLGERLRELRAQRGVTQAEMADGLGVSSAYLSALEHGHRGVPSWSFLQRLVGYFNLIWDDAEELQALAAISHPRVVVDTAGLPSETTRLANKLAATVAELSPEDCAEIEQLLDELSRKG